VVPQEPPQAEEPQVEEAPAMLAQEPAEEPEAPMVSVVEEDDEPEAEAVAENVAVVEEEAVAENVAVVEEEAPAEHVAVVEEEAVAENVAVVEEEGSADQNPIANELLDTVNLIVSCYDETGVPPAVTELHGLISAGEYEEVRSEITNIWNSLLKYHQQTGTRLQHQVTTTFNTINSIVRKMDRAS